MLININTKIEKSAWKDFTGILILWKQKRTRAMYLAFNSMTDSQISFDQL